MSTTTIYPISKYPVPHRTYRPLAAVALIPLVAFILTDLADIVTTVLVLRTGVGREADAPIAWMIQHSNLASIVLPLVVATPVAYVGHRFANSRGYRSMAVLIVVVLWIAALWHGITVFTNINTLHVIAAGR